MKAILCRHRASIFIFTTLLIFLCGIAYSVGLTQFLIGTTVVLKFLRAQAVTIVFLLVMGSVITWIMRLHFSRDPAYVNFDLKKLVSKPNGEPDPKKISLWLATAMGTYAFFYLLIHDRPTFSSFGIYFLGVLFAYAGVTEFLGKKEPPSSIKPPPTPAQQEISG